MSGLDLNDFEDSAVIAAISSKTQRLRQAYRDAEIEYREWVEGLEAITGVDFDPELEPSDGAGPPPPSESAPSPPSPAPPSRNRPASRADKQRQVDVVVEVLRELGGRQGLGAITRGAVSLTTYQAKSAMGEAVRAGRVEAVGKGAGTRYAVVESKAPVSEGPPPGRGRPTTVIETPTNGGHSVERQQPTLQGRILSALQMGEASASGLSISLGAPLEEITPALGHLVHDGDVSMAKGGRYRLAA